MLLPEVVDPSNWYEGKHHYDDPENRYIFVFEGTPRSGEITYNTKLVNPSEIKSYWDLLNQKSGGLYDSLREDISKEKVSDRARRVEGAQFLWLNPEWIEDLDKIRDIIKKALASAGKGK